MRRTTGMVGAAVVGMLVCTTMVGASAAHAASKWTKLGAAAANFGQPGLARTSDGALHVVWVPRSSAGGDNLLHTPIARNGAVGSNTTVVSGWSDIWATVDLGLDAGGLRAFFGGMQSTDANENNKYLNTATSPASGDPWALQDGNVAQGSGQFGGDVGVTQAGDGTWFEASGSAYVHRGLDPSTPNYDYQAQLGGCCGYDADLATDASSGRVWIAWFSNATNHAGVYVQEVDTSSGAPIGSPVRLAGSATGGQAVQQIQRTPIVARSGGDIYVAYTSGYPATTKVLLWKIDASGPSSNPIVIAKTASGELRHPAVAADGNGRMWVAWEKNSSSGHAIVYARRSNKSATRFGATTKLAGPSGDCPGLYSLTTNAQATTLDVVGNFSTGCGGVTEFWTAQMDPALSLAASPTKFSGKQTITFTVTDAGDQVAGATVTAGGKSVTTNARGVAKITLGPYGSSKTITVIATMDGYAKATTTLHAS